MPEIIFYRTLDGKIPVIDFLDSLSGKQAQKITWVLQYFEDTHIVPRQYFKKLVNTEDIWEIRIIYANEIFRILGFFGDSGRFIATNGFKKKTQKTPDGEIRLAEKRKKLFLERTDK